MYKSGDEWGITPLTKEEWTAVQAVYAGTGNERQQRLALQVVISNLANTHALTFINGSPDGTAFFLGRQYVGKILINCINNPYKEEPANVSKTE
ncbi:MAG: hypothetical protein JAY90_20200 [Candidatus Thiodiazotropha lotti]|nr:hypothetical protein [Candidatus Thiodiazotropha lotti]